MPASSQYTCVSGGGGVSEGGVLLECVVRGGGAGAGVVPVHLC